MCANGSLWHCAYLPVLVNVLTLLEGNKDACVSVRVGLSVCMCVFLLVTFPHPFENTPVQILQKIPLTKLASFEQTRDYTRPLLAVIQQFTRENFHSCEADNVLG